MRQTRHGACHTVRTPPQGSLCLSPGHRLRTCLCVHVLIKEVFLGEAEPDSPKGRESLNPLGAWDLGGGASLQQCPPSASLPPPSLPQGPRKPPPSPSRRHQPCRGLTAARPARRTSCSRPRSCCGTGGSTCEPGWAGSAGHPPPRAQSLGLVPPALPCAEGVCMKSDTLRRTPGLHLSTQRGAAACWSSPGSRAKTGAQGRYGQAGASDAGRGLGAPALSRVCAQGLCFPMDEGGLHWPVRLCHVQSWRGVGVSVRVRPQVAAWDLLPHGHRAFLLRGPTGGSQPSPQDLRRCCPVPEEPPALAQGHPCHRCLPFPGGHG